MKTINWKDHLINLIVVIFGISIAFQLNNWKADQQADDLEKKFCASFISDLEADITSLEAIVDTSEFYLHNVKRILSLAREKKFEHDSLVDYLVTLYAYTEFLPQNVTYETFKSSGGLEILKDFRLTKKINKLYGQQYGYIAIIDPSHKDQQQNKLTPYINASIEFGRTARLRNKDLLKDNNFINLVNGSQYLLQSKISIYKNALLLTRELKGDIETYLSAN